MPDDKEKKEGKMVDIDTSGPCGYMANNKKFDVGV